MKNFIIGFLILCLFSCKRDEFKFSYCLNSTLDSIGCVYKLDSANLPNLVIKLKTRDYLVAEKVFAVNVSGGHQTLKRLDNKSDDGWYSIILPVRKDQYNLIASPRFYIIKDSVADPICIDTMAINFVIDSAFFANNIAFKVSDKTLKDSASITLGRIKNHYLKKK